LIPLGVTLVIAVAGVAVMQFGLLDKLGLGSSEESEPAAATTAAGAPAASTTPSSESPAGTTGAGDETASGAKPEEGTSAGMKALEAELAKHNVVVLVAYAPDSSVDIEVTRDARLAASDVQAGFVSINASVEKQIRELATEYDIRDTPTVLVFTRGPLLGNRLIGYVDRTTVAQAAVEARAIAG
jgi:hypothetical protein